MSPRAPHLARRLGQNLIVLRDRASLSQGMVAERAGLHAQEIALLERGLRLPRLDTIVKLAGAVEVEPCELLAGMSWRLPREAKATNTSGLA
jgi:transcriptional regulator with XRE-family HTH domain